MHEILTWHGLGEAHTSNVVFQSFQRFQLDTDRKPIKSVSVCMSV